MEQRPFWETNTSCTSQEIPHFMEPEGSFPHSQEHATCPCPEPDRFSPYSAFHFSKIYFNIILPSTLGSY
jgi:hypothetical protein